jgi:hypothetical protein
MFQAMRKQMNPATILALVALVFSVTGGAFAATGGGGGAGSGSKATALAMPVAATAKKKAKAPARGPAGPRGATGAAGSAGSTGPAGGTGPQGPAGNNGSNGAPGEKGEKGEKGPKGEIGAKGETGFTATLPSGKTETGEWTFSGAGPGLVGFVSAQISFPIPLAQALSGGGCEEGKEPCHVHYIATSAGHEVGGLKEQTSKYCKGNAGDPEAAPGNLCIYEEQTFGVKTTEVFGVDAAEVASITNEGTSGTYKESQDGTGVAGAVVIFDGEAEKANYGLGSWAVTAE